MQRDLMKTYSADPWSFHKASFACSHAFIFNDEDLNNVGFNRSHSSRIFGSPTLGMGFRISASIGQLALDMVWAEIVVAAIAGSAFYGIVAIIEKGSHSGTPHSEASKSKVTTKTTWR